MGIQGEITEPAIFDDIFDGVGNRTGYSEQGVDPSCLIPTVKQIIRLWTFRYKGLQLINAHAENLKLGWCQPLELVGGEEKFQFFNISGDEARTKVGLLHSEGSWGTSFERSEEL